MEPYRSFIHAARAISFSSVVSSLLQISLNGLIFTGASLGSRESPIVGLKGISDTIQKLVVDTVNQELDQILSNLTLAQMSGYYSDHYEKQEMYYI